LVTVIPDVQQKLSLFKDKFDEICDKTANFLEEFKSNDALKAKVSDRILAIRSLAANTNKLAGIRKDFNVLL
jgi:hypothetical protein